MEKMEKMKKSMMILTVFMVILMTSVFGASVVSEIPLCTDANDQRNPAIFGDVVVWMNRRNGNWDIYGFNLSTSTEFQIITSGSEQFAPAIYGNTVVWRDDRNGNYDIYGYDLSTSEEFQITTDERNQRAPAIYCNVVVWRDQRNRNDDIYGALLDTNFCRMSFYTPAPVDTINPMKPLAEHRISQAQSLLEEIQKTCEEFKEENDPLYNSCCIDGLDEVKEFLELAEKFYASGNYVAANYWSLRALELLQAIQECYTQ
ncbi:MAG: hypothetical protein AYK19_14565 [Theionarchaea archaeon DG-70-1]|nr:MAG: hypothetical protein AYK19_14565 [Theionarchaea archaeon DG-70-1]